MGGAQCWERGPVSNCWGRRGRGAAVGGAQCWERGPVSNCWGRRGRGAAVGGALCWERGPVSNCWGRRGRGAAVGGAQCWERGPVSNCWGRRGRGGCSGRGTVLGEGCTKLGGAVCNLGGGGDGMIMGGAVRWKRSTIGILIPKHSVCVKMFGRYRWLLCFLITCRLPSPSLTPPLPSPPPIQAHRREVHCVWHSPKLRHHEAVGRCQGRP